MNQWGSGIGAIGRIDHAHITPGVSNTHCITIALVLESDIRRLAALLGASRFHQSPKTRSPQATPSGL